MTSLHHPMVVVSLVVGLVAAPFAVTGEAQDASRRLVEHLQMRRPEGSGPFAAIMLVPVCSGMSKKEHVLHYRDMVERLNAMAYLVVHVDYVAARGLVQACGSFVPPDEIAQDILSVAKHLRSFPVMPSTSHTSLRRLQPVSLTGLLPIIPSRRERPGRRPSG